MSFDGFEIYFYFEFVKNPILTKKKNPKMFPVFRVIVKEIFSNHNSIYNIKIIRN